MELITCDICGKETSASGDDILLFGEWMRRTQLTVHYFCLLLSSNLPQLGEDHSGIRGFLLSDIRKEVAAARKRNCRYCGEPGASIQCATCGKYFDLVCSVDNQCTVQFCGEFLSYCSECRPMDEYRKQLVAHPPRGVRCDICLVPIPVFGLNHIAFPECCRKGFAHKMCLRKYAISAGYYLRCIWCRSSDFRSTIPLQGIYVPDHEASWERQSNAFRELHQRNLRCDEEVCLCSRGRAYKRSVWWIYACQLCGSAGAHAQCLTQERKDGEPIAFTCGNCQEIEKKLEAQRQETGKEKDNDDTSSDELLVAKELPLLEINSEEDSDDDRTLLSPPLWHVLPKTKEPVSAASSLVPNESEATASTSSVAEAEAEDIDLMHLRALPKPRNPMMLRESFNCPGQPYFYLMVYEFDSNDNCKGSCTLRFDDKDPRVKDRSEEALRYLQVRREDVWFRNKDRGEYATNS